MRPGVSLSAVPALAVVLVLTLSVPADSYDSAIDEHKERQFKNVIELDADNSGAKEKVTLVKTSRRDFTNFDVVDDASLRIESAGKVFSAPINYPICYNASGLEDLSVGKGSGSFIAVSSCIPSADDDWKLIIYGFDGRSITEQLKITSNEPSIEIKDSDKDGSKDIVVMDRDNENNPEKDKFITTYKYVNNKWQRVSIYRTKTGELKTLPAE